MGADQVVFDPGSYPYMECLGIYLGVTVMFHNIEGYVFLPIFQTVGHVQFNTL